MRVGMGYDIHRFVRGRRLILGGLTIPYARGLAGHSDGDALIHAVIDAILGALAMGDIGEFFPDSSQSFKGASSIRLLKDVVGRMALKGYVLSNLDTVIVTEEPKLGPYKEKMRRSLAKLMSAKPGQISVKAKTAEGLGPIGQKRALSASCVLLLKKGRIKKL